MTNPYRFNQEHHLHELNVNGEWKPLIGTSSVLSVLNKNGLTWWASGLSVKEFGVPDPKVLTKIKNKKATKEEMDALWGAANDKLKELRSITTSDYVKLLDRAYRAHATNLKETADTGTDLHKILSDFVRCHMELEKGLLPPDTTWHPRIKPFIDWTFKNVNRFLWSEVHCYSRKHFLGGISDCGFIDKNGNFGILDFKSAREAYWSAFVQCAGYDIQISENGGFDAEGNLTFDTSREDGRMADYYAVLPFGMEQPQVQVNEDVAACRENFLHALALYRAMPRD